VQWELFVPDRFRVDRFGGDVFDAYLLAASSNDSGPAREYAVLNVGGAAAVPPLGPAQPGQINGRVVLAGGGPLPGATVVVEGAGQRQSAVTDAEGAYAISNLPTGTLTVTAQTPGFSAARRTVAFDQRGRQVNLALEIGGVSESVTVNADSPLVDTAQSSVSGRGDQAAARKAAEQMPSVNVQNLQRRAAGVLPVRMDVPRAGTSHRFVKPLVIDEETVVTFRYKRR
jgi:hypothetical protein